MADEQYKLETILGLAMSVLHTDCNTETCRYTVTYLNKLAETQTYRYILKYHHSL